MYNSVAISNVFSLSTEIGPIPNYTVWLNTSLQVEFNLSNSCTSYHLFSSNVTEVNIVRDRSPSSPVDGMKRLVTFTIPSVTWELNNTTMYIKASCPPNPMAVSRTFFIYIQGTDKTCTHQVRHSITIKVIFL